MKAMFRPALGKAHPRITPHDPDRLALPPPAAKFIAKLIASELVARLISMNPLHPGHMTASERLDEVADILAAGLIRLRAHQLRALLRAPEIIVQTWRTTRRTIDGLTEADVRDALERFDPLWDELFPAEQARIVHLLVTRVDISTEGADIRLRTQGLTSLVADLGAIQPERGGQHDGQAETH
jgi:hypothetical protein